MNEMNDNQNQLSEKVQEGLGAFFGKVYGCLAIGIGISAITSYLILNVYEIGYPFFNLIYNHNWVFWALWIGELALVFMLGAKAQKNPTLALGGFLAYSLLNGLTLSITLSLYTEADIAKAFLSATVTYGIMAIFGTVTKKNLSAIGQAAYSILIGIIIAMVINFFLQSGPLDFFISILTVLIFAGLTAWDHQKIKAIYLHHVETGEFNLSGMVIFCALELYLDFINLFLAFVRIFGRD